MNSLKRAFTSVFLLLLGFVANAQIIPAVRIDSVSVLDNSRVQLAWQASTDARVDGYYIYRLYENNFGETKFFDPIEASAAGRLTTSFIYQDNTGAIDMPGNKPLRFFVVAIDRDVNPIQQSLLDTTASRPHQTMFLQRAIDVCNAAVNLNWSRYNTTSTGFDAGVSRYEVWESQNGGNFQRVYQGPNTSFQRRGLLSNVNYEYKVRVVSADLSRTSTSNANTFSGTFSKAPNYVYLSNATVAANNSDVTINWLVDSANVRLTYQIMGSTDSITYTELERFDSVDWNVTRGEYSTVLNNLTPERNQYFFKIITSCSCPDTIDTTFVTKVVRLQASLLTENTNRVFWQDYEGWIQDVGYMEIHRVTLDPVTLTQRDTLLATLLPGVNEYIDNDSASFGAGQVISYYLRSFEQVGNPLGGGVRSQSNFAYIYREIQILAPTAFTPNGINNIFLPKIQSAYNNQFNMKIFNRWGKLVFETNDEFLGWDGRDRDSGDICAPGSYVYLIKANNSSGKTLEKVGNIALID